MPPSGPLLIGQFTILSRRAVTYTNDNSLALVNSSAQQGSSIHLSPTLPAPSVELVVISPVHDER